MSFRAGALDRLALPDGTTVREHDLVTDRDVVIGGQSDVELGVCGQNVIAGERVTVEGDIEAEGDCRLDMWCAVDGNVVVGRDAYVGERVTVDGRLLVSGDLDIGDDVDIGEGFEANGWIVIRNPIPTVVLFFVYLSQLLHLGDDAAAERLLTEVFADDPPADPVVIPPNARVSDDAWRVSTPAIIGDDCRLHGNVRAEEITVGDRNNVFGSLRARGDIAIGSSTRIHGDVTTRRGRVTLGADVQVLGDVSCERLQLHEDAIVDGTIRARDGVSMTRDAGRDQE